MSRYNSYLNSAVQIITEYSGQEPFASFIKKYFAQDRKYGSKDRKVISHLCYCYFRVATAVKNEPVEESILIGLFLCSSERNEVLEHLRPEWNEKIHLSVEEKCSMFNVQYSMLNLFSFTVELSDGIEREKFILSHLRQPDLFIRLRPGHETTVKEKFQNDGIIFNQVSETCLSLPNSTQVDKIIELNKEAVVQDYSSQRTAELLFSLKSKITNLKFKVWDCCAASGGKSIMLYDLYPNIELTVSDVRDSILNNLKNRFSQAGIKKYESFVTDLTGSHSLFTTHHSRFDLIICDVPCSGSGTWGRTPEQLTYFEKSKIDHYASIQKKIVSKVYAHLKAGSYLMYITCSVFKKENEEVVTYMRQTLKLELIQVKLLKGYHLHADTMFAALLRKQL